MKASEYIKMLQEITEKYGDAAMMLPDGREINAITVTRTIPEGATPTAISDRAKEEAPASSLTMLDIIGIVCILMAAGLIGAGIDRLIIWAVAK